MRLLILFITTWLLIFSNVHEVNAFNLGSDRFRLSGFGTVGVTSAGKKQFGYHKERNQNAQFGGFSAFNDSVIGLQLDADLISNLTATVQVVVEERVKYDFNNIVDWAFLRYQITPKLVARAGRMNADLFMLSEYRNVGFAYLWAHPVVEFYTPISLNHYDGLDFKYTRPVASGYLEFKVYGGQTSSDIKVSGGDLSLRTRPFYGANASLRTDLWRFRLIYAATEIYSIHGQLTGLLDTLNQVPQSAWPQAAALSNKLDGENKRVSYYSAGLAYDNNFWLVQSEIALISSGWESVNMRNGYVSVGRRFGPVTLYSIAASARTIGKPTQVVAPLVSTPTLSRLETVTRNVFNAPHINQNAISLGMRWDLNPRVAVKAQWDHTWVKKHGGGLLILKEPLEKDITLNTFSLNLNFIF